MSDAKTGPTSDFDNDNDVLVFPFILKEIPLRLSIMSITSS